ncbi:hypothetical protein LLT3_02965 [Lactococcus cremoris subsp. cremoris TIFN3]|uniref:HdeD family acid-resistance protein n=5 Tax=Lactococcus lactis subsp. cremoris TaxID=1359 RepID=T0VDM4_LACLC|nr:hypothetical protein LLT3_02965 [Lactococcus cremoris subsp. cremoris TIFN3]
MLTDFEKLRRGVGFSGIVSIIIGLLILFLPTKTAAIVAALVGVALVIMGVIYIGANLIRKSDNKGSFWRISHLLLGFIYLFAGIFVFSDLNAAAESLFVLIGIFVGVSWIIDGIVTLTVLRDFNSKFWGIILSIISIIAGFTLVFSPLWGAVTLWLLLGIEFVVVGLIKMIHYYRWDKSTLFLILFFYLKIFKVKNKSPIFCQCFYSFSKDVSLNKGRGRKDCNKQLASQKVRDRYLH